MLGRSRGNSGRECTPKQHLSISVRFGKMASLLTCWPAGHSQPPASSASGHCDRSQQTHCALRKLYARSGATSIAACSAFRDEGIYVACSYLRCSCFEFTQGEAAFTHANSCDVFVSLCHLGRTTTADVTNGPNAGAYGRILTFLAASNFHNLEGAISRGCLADRVTAHDTPRLSCPYLHSMRVFFC